MATNARLRAAQNAIAGRGRGCRLDAGAVIGDRDCLLYTNGTLSAICRCRTLRHGKGDRDHVDLVGVEQSGSATGFAVGGEGVEVHDVVGRLGKCRLVIPVGEAIDLLLTGGPSDRVHQNRLLGWDVVLNFNPKKQPDFSEQ